MGIRYAARWIVVVVELGVRGGRSRFALLGELLMAGLRYVRVLHSPFGRMFISLDREVTAQLIEKFAEFLKVLGPDVVAGGLLN